MPEGRAQRPLRRQPRRDLRGPAAAAASGSAPTTGSSRTARSWRCSTATPVLVDNALAPHERLGQHVPRARPLRPRRGRARRPRRPATAAAAAPAAPAAPHARRSARRRPAHDRDRPAPLHRHRREHPRHARPPAVGRARRRARPTGARRSPSPTTMGAERLLPVPAAALDGTGERQKVKHVKAAVLAGLAGGPDAELGRGYVRHLARRQAEAGAALPRPQRRRGRQRPRRRGSPRCAGSSPRWRTPRRSRSRSTRRPPR